MVFHLQKASRFYTGFPYCGPTIRSSGLNQPAEFSSTEEALRYAKLFQQVNPVGWNIYCADTQKQVGTHDGLF